MGPATVARRGPLVNSPPTLTYSPQVGYKTDGVHPNVGSAHTSFVFRCVYTDADNDEPAAIVARIWCSGNELGGSPFAMQTREGTSCAQGRIYEAAVILDQAGSYSYRFEASDGIAAAVGEATATKSGRG